SRPHPSPEDLRVLLGNIQRLNETFRDLQLQLLLLPARGEILDHVWRLQDLLQNHSDSLLRAGTTLRRLQELLELLQSRAGATDAAVAELRDSLNRQGDHSQLELSRLSVAGNGSQLLLEHHSRLLERLGGRMESLEERLELLGGSVDSMNRSFSYELELQRSRLRDFFGMVGNVTEEAR
ncbi:scavenger receptor class A member 5-like, partial [Neopelma chrysocephalum]|uniref:scavenger receptor class A member 5-like n=1 Tax=Neopelma chrysocephalum TaxID=114329 RepID=UPI000FCCFB69